MAIAAHLLGPSVNILHFLGFAVYREGNIIDLGFTQLQIVEACSGLRYALPLIVMAMVVGYLSNKKYGERILLVFVSVPVSIFSNSLQIVALAFLSKSSSLDISVHSFFHDFSGWLVFVFSVSILCLVSAGLNRIRAGRLESDSIKQNEKGPETRVIEGLGRRWPSWKNAVLAIIFLVVLHFTHAFLIRAQISPHRMDFGNFPFSMKGWDGQREYLSREILDALWADDYVTGTFSNKATGNRIHLLVSYYKTQTTYHTAHAPTSCLLGGGWDLLNWGVLPSDPLSGRDFPVQQMLLEKGGTLTLSNFWFQQRGRIITSEYMNKCYLFWDSIRMRRTDGSLVRLEMVLAQGQSVDQGQVILNTFAAELKRKLTGYIPD